MLDRSGGRVRRSEVDIIGLDLSLRNTAAVWLPHDWKPGDWRRVFSTMVGYGLTGSDPRERAERLHKIASELVEWIGKRPAHIYVEDYAYGLAAKSGMVVAELGGAVKFALMQKGRVAIPVNQSTARKYLLGKLPPKDRAQAVMMALKAWGTPFESSDENDALVIANYARTEHGLPGLTIASEEDNPIDIPAARRKNARR